MERSGGACDFWSRPEEALDRAAAIGCNAFRLSVEWARLEPEPGRFDDTALERYVQILEMCAARGLEPGDHPAPLHPPGVVGRGVLVATGGAGPLRPACAARGAVAGPALPAMGDRQRAQRRDAPGLDRWRAPTGAAPGLRRRLLRARQPPHGPRARVRRHRRRAAGGPGDLQHEFVIGLRARPAPHRSPLAALGRGAGLRCRPLCRRAARPARRLHPPAAHRGAGAATVLRRHQPVRHAPRCGRGTALGPTALRHPAAGPATHRARRARLGPGPGPGGRRAGLV